MFKRVEYVLGRFDQNLAAGMSQAEAEEALEVDLWFFVQGGRNQQ